VCDHCHEGCLNKQELPPDRQPNRASQVSGGKKLAAVLVVGFARWFPPSSSCCLRLAPPSECRRTQHDEGNETKVRVEGETK
jgi:hypothetical protein